HRPAVADAELVLDGRVVLFHRLEAQLNALPGLRRRDALAVRRRASEQRLDVAELFEEAGFVEGGGVAHGRRRYHFRGAAPSLVGSDSSTPPGDVLAENVTIPSSSKYGIVHLGCERTRLRPNDGTPSVIAG